MEQETTVGYIAEFNIWNYSMTKYEISNGTCGTHGNVVSWTGSESTWGTLVERDDSINSTNAITTCTGKSQIASIASLRSL